jgi:hypothetical protein
VADPKSPGQVAYIAYAANAIPLKRSVVGYEPDANNDWGWRDLQKWQRAAWEAAARAVLDDRVAGIKMAQALWCFQNWCWLIANADRLRHEQIMRMMVRL